MNPTDNQLKQAFDKLDELNAGETILVSYSKLPELFKICVKMYIDCFQSCEFNKDYTVVRKISYLKPLIIIDKRSNPTLVQSDSEKQPLAS